MMHELTYAFPILSWLAFLYTIIAPIHSGRDGWRVIGRFPRSEAIPARLPS